MEGSESRGNGDKRLVVEERYNEGRKWGQNQRKSTLRDRNYQKSTCNN